MQSLPGCYLKNYMYVQLCHFDGFVCRNSLASAVPLGHWWVIWFPSHSGVLRRPKVKPIFFPFLVPLDPQDPGIPGGGEPGEPGDPLGIPDAGIPVVQLYSCTGEEPGQSGIPDPRSGGDPKLDPIPGIPAGIPGYRLYIVQYCTLYPFRNVEMSQNLKIVRSIVACRH